MELGGRPPFCRAWGLRAPGCVPDQGELGLGSEQCTISLRVTIKLDPLLQLLCGSSHLVLTLRMHASRSHCCLASLTPGPGQNIPLEIHPMGKYGRARPISWHGRKWRRHLLPIDENSPCPFHGNGRGLPPASFRSLCSCDQSEKPESDYSLSCGPASLSVQATTRLSYLTITCPVEGTRAAGQLKG